MKKDIYKNLKLFKYSRIVNNKNKRKNCLIIGSFGAYNLGDEAILAGQISELIKLGVKEITVAGEIPEEIQRYHNVNALKIKNLPKMVVTVISSGLIILGGGGLFCKNLSSYRGFLYQGYLITLAFLGYILRKDISAIGIGFYKNQNYIIKNMAQSLLRRIDVVTVRDFHSLKELESMGVNAKIYKDTSYFMKLLTKKQVLKEKFFKENFIPNVKRIGISLVNHKVNEKYKPRVIREMKKFIEEYPNATYWYYTLDSGYGSNSDYFIGKELEAKVNKQRSKKIRFVFVPSTFSPEIIFSSFGLMDSLITTRFHASMFAYRNNLRFAGISYDEKCSSFLDSIGKKYIRMENISASFIDSELKKKD